MNMRIPLLAAPVLLLMGCNADSMTPTDPVAGLEELPAQLAKGGRPEAGEGPGVYVTSQGLYYKTFVAVDPLPFQGEFQKIENGMTEFGPGDPGYLGGRWWEDTNGNGYQDADDHFFLCPLLGKGHSSPPA